mmetsp:Transcript_39426/g.47414  ORF Transcript_39426/g.47414 Transcript_39426/m.47414 type:complete len:301 (+) Transcript_39426:745-1647(+)
MFRHDKSKKLFLMRFIPEIPLWATCDSKDFRKKRCFNMLQKFLPLMGIDPDSLGTSPDSLISFENFQLNVTKEKQVEKNSNIPKYVCAKFGAAGLGALTDHGTKKIHGWEENDYKITQNHGRGAMLYAFRNFMMKNVGVPLKELDTSGPHKITFSVFSATRSRAKGFEHQIEEVKNRFSSDEVEVGVYQMHELSAKEQIRIASESAIYITSVGGGSFTASFLPFGSSVFLYYDDVGGLNKSKPSNKPARLDWDIFNNDSHFRVHWLPMGMRSSKERMDSQKSLDSLVDLIRHELDVITHL